MSIAQKLRNGGRVEGLVEGVQKGVCLGRLQTLQQIIGLPVEDDSTLSVLPVEDLRQRFDALQAECNLRHKV